MRENRKKKGWAGNDWKIALARRAARRPSRSKSMGTWGGKGTKRPKPCKFGAAE